MRLKIRPRIRRNANGARTTLPIASIHLAGFFRAPGTDARNSHAAAAGAFTSASASRKTPTRGQPRTSHQRKPNAMPRTELNVKYYKFTFFAFL